MWPVLLGFALAAFGLVVGGGDVQAAKAVAGAVFAPGAVAWCAGVIAVHGERWWSRTIAAAVAVGAVAGGVWLYLLILDEL